MAVIKKLGDRVEKEHDQFLRDSQRIEDRSATAVNGSVDGPRSRAGMDFETLVGGAGTGNIKADTELSGNWEDDVWGSILSSGSEVRFPLQMIKKEEMMTDFCRPPQSPSIPQTAFVPPMSAQSQSTTQSLPSSPRIGTTVGAQLSRPLTSRTNTGSNGTRTGMSIPPPPISSSTFLSTSPHAMGPPAQNTQPKYQGGLLSSQSTSQPPQRTSVSKPNYNISLSDVTTISNQQPPPAVPFMTPPSQINQLHAPTSNILSTSVVSPAFSPRPGMGDILTPLKPQRRSLSGVGAKTQASTKDILSDFDPLA
jgi:SCY1-like protein 2